MNCWQEVSKVFRAIRKGVADLRFAILVRLEMYMQMGSCGIARISGQAQQVALKHILFRFDENLGQMAIRYFKSIAFYCGGRHGMNAYPVPIGTGSVPDTLTTAADKACIGSAYFAPI